MERKQRGVDYSDGIALLDDPNVNDENEAIRYKSEENCKNKMESKTFFGNSSIQAVSQMRQSVTKRRRFFWMAVLVMCFAGCSYETYSFLTVYLQYPVIVDIKVFHNLSLEIPAVSICNLNNVKAAYAHCVMKEIPPHKCVLSKKQGNRLIFSMRKKFLNRLLGMKDDSNAKKIELLEFTRHYLRLKEEHRIQYGHKLPDIVKKCSYKSVPCCEEDFANFSSLQFGNCFTFNSRSRKGESHLKAAKSGPSGGLELDLEIQERDYIPLTSETGMRIVIHEVDENPNPEESGINISPGYETHIEIAKKSFHRLPAPFKDRCVEYEASGNENIYKSQTDCIRQCLQRYSLSNCFCVDPFLPSGGMKHCDLENSTQMTCLDSVLTALSEKNLSCSCPLPCHSTSYNLRVFSTALILSNWNKRPNHSASEQEASSSCVLADQTEVTTTNRKYLTLTRAKVKVFYRNFEHTIYSQKAVFSDSEMYANIGGHFGLWLGLSLIAIFEYAEHIYSLIRFYWQKNNQGINYL